MVCSEDETLPSHITGEWQSQNLKPALSASKSTCLHVKPLFMDDLETSSRCTLNSYKAWIIPKEDQLVFSPKPGFVSLPVTNAWHKLYKSFLKRRKTHFSSNIGFSPTCMPQQTLSSVYKYVCAQPCLSELSFCWTQCHRIHPRWESEQGPLQSFSCITCSCFFKPKSHPVSTFMPE